MIRSTALFAIASLLALSSCSKKEAAEAPKPAAEAPAPAQPAGGPHAFVTLKDGSKVPGTIVASSPNDLVLSGDDGIERKIPMTQVKSVEYGDTKPAGTPPSQTARRAESQPAQSQQAASAPPPAPPAPAVTTRTYELPVASEVSVRTNEAIDSATAQEGRTYDAQVTRAAKDADGAVVIPRGASARIVIRSASKGGRFRGSSDLVLDLQSVVINGRTYSIDTAEITQKGRSGVGANKRTVEYTGGGAALGAIIGAIAGGGKGAAIGAGAGAGAGALTQVVTKGRSIKVPAESVLTFKLDKTLRVTATE
jgi:hypothetical protein